MRLRSILIPVSGLLAAATLAASAATVVAAAPIIEGTLLVVDHETGRIFESASGGVNLDEVGGDSRTPGVVAIEVDSTTGTGFALQGDAVAGPFTLLAIDSLDAGYRRVGSLTDSAGGALLGCASLDYFDGVLSASCLTRGAWTVGTVDPQTGVYTERIQVREQLTGIATDPVTGLLYGLTVTQTRWQLLRLDQNGPVVIGLVDGVSGPVHELSFDSFGGLWAVRDATAGRGELVRIEPSLLTTMEFDVVGDGFVNSHAIGAAHPLKVRPVASPTPTPAPTSTSSVSPTAEPKSAASPPPPPALPATGVTAVAPALVAIAALASGLAALDWRRRNPFKRRRR